MLRQLENIRTINLSHPVIEKKLFKDENQPKNYKKKKKKILGLKKKKRHKYINRFF
jgi:hypothetical protein